MSILDVTSTGAYSLQLSLKRSIYGQDWGLCLGQQGPGSVSGFGEWVISLTAPVKWPATVNPVPADRDFISLMCSHPHMYLLL